MIGMIAAVDLSGLIGYGGQLPFKNSTDLKRFKSITMGSTLIMGRKTWESLPKKSLPERTIHVLHFSSADKYINTENVFHFNRLEDAILSAETQDIWIAGGGEIYKDAVMLNIPEVIDLTIHNYLFFPPVDDKLSTVRQKSVYLPEISYFYQVEFEETSDEDPILIHRRYRLRDPDKWGYGNWDHLRNRRLEDFYYRKHGSLEGFAPTLELARIVFRKDRL